MSKSVGVSGTIAVAVSHSSLGVPVAGAPVTVMLPVPASVAPQPPMRMKYSVPVTALKVAWDVKPGQPGPSSLQPTVLRAPQEPS